MKTKYTNIIVIGIILLSIIFGIYFYPLLPDSIASHWDGKGVVNGYMPKFWGIFFMPLILIGCFILFRYLPRLTHLKKILMTLLHIIIYL
jgi:uncharacterized membrane protein